MISYEKKTVYSWKCRWAFILVITVMRKKNGVRNIFNARGHGDGGKCQMYDQKGKFDG